VVSAWTLRLLRDRLPPGASRALPPAARVLYASCGQIEIAHAGARVRLGADSAWHGTEACALTAGVDGAALLRWELSRPTGGGDGELLLEQPIDLAPDAAWLMRCDRVDFERGGVALPHRHRGGGIRCLIAGALEVTVGDAAPVLVQPGGAWYESGREPVVARASTTETTSFVRVSILPAGIRGRSSILYVDPADAARGKPRRYTVWVDAPIQVE
jgi:hypothetical protein